MYVLFHVRSLYWEVGTGDDSVGGAGVVDSADVVCEPSEIVRGPITFGGTETGDPTGEDWEETVRLCRRRT